MPHLISPDSSRFDGVRRRPAVRSGAPSAAATEAQSVWSTIRSSGTSCTFHSLSGLGRDTRLRVAGSRMKRCRLNTILPA